MVTEPDPNASNASIGTPFELMEGAQGPTIRAIIGRLGQRPPTVEEVRAHEAAREAEEAVLEKTKRVTQARKHAVMMIMAAIKRNGGDPLDVWEDHYVDALWSQADQLVALDR
jgi:hypothetical protein